ncbi:MAG: amidohydrolase family protein [Steroidobacteraceae bacterium]
MDSHPRDSSAREAEAVLHAAQRICDPHHHLMDNAWARYQLEDLLTDLRSGHRVVSTVYVEAGAPYRSEGPESLRPVGEVEYVRGLDAPEGVMAGIVAFADLRLGSNVEAVLDAQEAAGKGRLRGIRFMTAWDPHPELNFLSYKPTAGLLRDPTVLQAIKQVGRRGLPLDCWMYAHQLDDLIAAARALPDQVFVLDHMGTPLVAGPYADRREHVFVEWRLRMSELAACSNVRLKIGGLALEMQGAPWARGTWPNSEEIAAFWRDHVLWCVEKFGASRCMFESNFPIDRLVVRYVSLWNAYKRMVAHLSPGERDDLFYGTAHCTYLSA